MSNSPTLITLHHPIYSGEFYIKECLKLLVSVYVSCYPKPTLLIPINQWLCFGLISMENMNLEYLIWSHFYCE